MGVGGGPSRPVPASPHRRGELGAGEQAQEEAEAEGAVDGRVARRGQRAVLREDELLHDGAGRARERRQQEQRHAERVAAARGGGGCGGGRRGGGLLEAGEGDAGDDEREGAGDVAVDVGLAGQERAGGGEERQPAQLRARGNITRI